jgi:hypothetical protein
MKLSFELVKRYLKKILFILYNSFLSASQSNEKVRILETDFVIGFVSNNNFVFAITNLRKTEPIH